MFNDSLTKNKLNVLIHLKKIKLLNPFKNILQHSFKTNKSILHNNFTIAKFIFSLSYSLLYNNIMSRIY